MKVVEQCPFAATFGIAGQGEGIVWKAVHPLGQDPRFWVKTKPSEVSHQILFKFLMYPYSCLANSVSLELRH